MNESLLDDALLMREATDGNPELLAVDLWLHDIFALLRTCDGPSEGISELPQ